MAGGPALHPHPTMTPLAQPQLLERLDEAVDRGEIGLRSPVFGIALKAIELGEGALDAEQAALYRAHARPYLMPQDSAQEPRGAGVPQAA